MQHAARNRANTQWGFFLGRFTIQSGSGLFSWFSTKESARWLKSFQYTFKDSNLRRLVWGEKVHHNRTLPHFSLQVDNSMLLVKILGSTKMVSIQAFSKYQDEPLWKIKHHVQPWKMRHQMQIEILNGGEILTNFKFELNQNLDLNL